MITRPIISDLVRGALELERTERGLRPHRLPARARAQCADGQLAMAEAQPSGVRLVFRTTATAIELDTLRTTMNYQGAPPRPGGVYDLLVDGELTAQASTTGGNTVLIDLATGTSQAQQGPAGTVRFEGLPERAKQVEIWLPHNELTELVDLRTNAPIEPVPPQGRTWLHHGSSISNGSNAASPTGTWPALAAASAGVQLVNLGFSGSALLDPFTARTLRDLPAEVISLKLGINLVNADLMRLRAFGPAVHGFLDTIREGHPDTPLLVVSPILCPIHEHTPGPGMPDFSTGQVLFHATGEPAPGKLTLTVIREELARIVEQRQAEDANLHYLDGRELYGEADFAELPLPDRLHPDAATHRRIGARFAALAFGPGGPLSNGAAR
ncbi:GDSL-type esterase/lipase family protein [Crossiella sp. NPDC003009]